MSLKGLDAIIHLVYLYPFPLLSIVVSVCLWPLLPPPAPLPPPSIRPLPLHTVCQGFRLFSPLTVFSLYIYVCVYIQYISNCTLSLFLSLSFSLYIYIFMNILSLVLFVCQFLFLYFFCQFIFSALSVCQSLSQNIF